MKKLFTYTSALAECVNIPKRVCRDCPIPGYDAKYIVRLATAGGDKNTSQQEDEREQDMVHELSWAKRKMDKNKTLAEKRKNSQEREAGEAQDTRKASECRRNRRQGRD